VQILNIYFFVRTCMAQRSLNLWCALLQPIPAVCTGTAVRAPQTVGFINKIRQTVVCIAFAGLSGLYWPVCVCMQTLSTLQCFAVMCSRAPLRREICILHFSFCLAYPGVPGVLLRGCTFETVRFARFKKSLSPPCSTQPLCFLWEL
jgi:hypothetical protein